MHAYILKAFKSGVELKEIECQQCTSNINNFLYLPLIVFSWVRKGIILVYHRLSTCKLQREISKIYFFCQFTGGFISHHPLYIIVWLYFWDDKLKIGIHIHVQLYVTFKCHVNWEMINNIKYTIYRVNSNLIINPTTYTNQLHHDRHWTIRKWIIINHIYILYYR